MEQTNNPQLTCFYPLYVQYEDVDLSKLKPKKYHNCTPNTRFIVTEYHDNIFGKRVNCKSSIATCSSNDLLDVATILHNKLGALLPTFAFFEGSLFSKKIEGNSLWTQITEGIWPEVKDICEIMNSEGDDFDSSAFYCCDELTNLINNNDFPSHENIFYNLGLVESKFHNKGIDIGHIEKTRYENERKLENYIQDNLGNIWLVDIDPQTTKFKKYISIEDRLKYLNQSIFDFQKSNLMWNSLEKRAYIEGYLFESYLDLFEREYILNQFC